MKPSANEKKSVDIERYAVIRESAQYLLSIMELENTTYEEKIRILNAIMEITKMEKSEDDSIRKSLISDVIKNGVLRHYFSEANRKRAEANLNETTILNSEEETLYKLNFLIPDDKEFVKNYKDSGKSIIKVKKTYDIPDAMVISSKLVEIAKYSEAYRSYLADRRTELKKELEEVTREEASVDFEEIDPIDPIKPEDDDLLARLDELQKKHETKEKIEIKEEKEEPMNFELPIELPPIIEEKSPELYADMDEIPAFLKRYIHPEKQDKKEEKSLNDVDNMDEISELIACAEKGLEQLRTENKKKDEIIESHGKDFHKAAEVLKQEYEAKLAAKELELAEQSERLIKLEREMKETKEQLETTQKNNSKLLSFVKLVSKELEKS